MFKWAMMTLVLLVGVQSTAAGYTAPVEVHMNTGDALYMYDCYPLSADSPAALEMLVYVTYAEGIVGYACDYGGGAWVRPFAPRFEHHAQYLGSEK